MKNKVAIIYGGRGDEHDISRLSADFVLRSVDREKFDPIPILITRSGDWLITDGITDGDGGISCYPARFSGGSGLMTPTELLPVLCAFPVLHGSFGEDGVVQGALECAGIKYVGCKPLGGALCADKAATKTVAESLGIPTAEWVLGTDLPSDDYIAAVKRRAELLFGYPMFIKPSGGGSSIGISKIYRESEFEKAYKSAARYGNRIIIEEALDVDLELECAIFIDKSKHLFTKVGSVSNFGDFYDYDKKYKYDSVTASEYSRLEADRESAISEFSRSLAKSLDLRQLSRVDFFLTKRGQIIFNEINTMPGFTERSLFPRLISKLGFSPTELITELITGAC